MKARHKMEKKKKQERSKKVDKKMIKIDFIKMKNQTNDWLKDHLRRQMKAEIKD